MTTPKLEITAEPGNGNSVYYLPLVKKAKGEIERLKIALCLRIKNIDTDHDPITIVGITYSFSSLGASTMAREQQYMDPKGGVLGLGDVATWSNGSVCKVDVAQGDDCPEDEKYFNQVYLDSPAPSTITVNVHCDGDFDEAASQTFDLIPWTDPTGHGPVRLPFAVEDLEDDEYIVTSAQHWYNGGSRGTQIFAHDIVVEGQVGGSWTHFRQGTDTSNASNEDVRIFGLPVRAIDDGVVVEVKDEYADNSYGTEDGVPKGSNFVRVHHGDLEVWYKHLRSGSVRVRGPQPASGGQPSQPGQSVRSGQVLAEAGNSGNTSNPHLHMECRTVTGKHLCGFVFKSAWIVEQAQIPATGGPGPRVHLDGKGICWERAAIRPFTRTRAPIGRPLPRPELEELLAEIVAGVAEGGGGFVIIGGKLVRVPPRGIRAELLRAIVALDEVETLGKDRVARELKKIADDVAKIAQDLARRTR